MTTQLFFIRETRKVVSLILNNNKQRIGNIRFSPPCPHNYPNTAYINNIYVDPNYRNKNIGSKMLKHMNIYLKENTNAKKINGVLWDDTKNLYLSNFFEKNGYTLSKDQIHFHDDGENMIEIIPVERELTF